MQTPSDNIQGQNIQNQGHATTRLADRPQSLLRLRFCGGDRDGQVIRVASLKCTIGSSPNATLRIMCPGLNPMHCMILRGAGGTVVRSMSPSTKLNGQPFSDAPLHAGDRLTIGPIEFEVLSENEVNRTESPQHNSDLYGELTRIKSEFQRERASWQQQQRDLQQQIAELSRELGEANAACERATETHEQDAEHHEHAELEQQVESLREELEQVLSQRNDSNEQWSAEREQLNAELSDVREDLNGKQTELNTLAEELNRLRDTLQQTEQTDSEFEDLQGRCQELQDEVERSHQALSDKEHEYQSVKSQLDALQGELETARRTNSELDPLRIQCDELRQQAAAAEQDRDEATQRQADLSQALESAQSQLEAREQAYNDVVTEIESLKATFESASHDDEETIALQQRCDELVRELDAANQERSELLARADGFAAEQAQWQAQREAFQDQIDAIQSELSAAQEACGSHRDETAALDELTERLQWLEQSRSESELELESYKQQLVEAQQRITEYEADAEERAAMQTHDSDDDLASEERPQPATDPDPAIVLDRVREQLAIHGHESRDSESSSVLPESPESDWDGADLDSDYQPVTEDSLAFSEPEDAAPIDTASILAKYGQTLDEVKGSEPATDSSYQDVHVAEVALEGKGDDDHIENYMAQLMARVGGGTEQAPSPKIKTKHEPVGTAEEERALQATTKGSEKPLDPSEFVPRAVAPEATSNLKALRAVANTSTRSAIDKHQQRHFDRRALVCLIISIVACVVFVSMAMISKTLMSLPTGVSIIAFVVAFFAILQALTNIVKARRAGRLEVATDPASEPSDADVEIQAEQLTAAQLPKLSVPTSTDDDEEHLVEAPDLPQNA